MQNLSCENEFYFTREKKNHFNISGFALSLTLKQRLRAPRNGLFAIEVVLETGSVLSPIGHFRVPKTLSFKMRLGAQLFLRK